MTKHRRKLDADEAVGLEINESEESEFSGLFTESQEKILAIKNDAAEAVESLNAIKSRIEEHKIKMQKLKNLGPDLF